MKQQQLKLSKQLFTSLKLESDRAQQFGMTADQLNEYLILNAALKPSQLNQYLIGKYQLTDAEISQIHQKVVDTGIAIYNSLEGSKHAADITPIVSTEAIEQQFQKETHQQHKVPEVLKKHLKRVKKELPTTDNNVDIIDTKSKERHKTDQNQVCQIVQEAIGYHPITIKLLGHKAAVDKMIKKQ